VIAGFGSLEEVRKRWTLEDVLDAHDLLDFREAVEARQLAAATPRGRR